MPNNPKPEKSIPDKLGWLPLGINIIALSWYGVYKMVEYFATSIIKIITQKKP